MIPAFTYSQLDTFTNCPRKFYFTKVTREVVEPPTIHTEWGTEVHTAMELAVRDGAPLPEKMVRWQKIADKFRAAPGEKLVEYKFALDRNMRPHDWDGAWTRGIADLTVLHNTSAVVADWKTGKRKPSDQLSLYAAYIFAHYERVQTVTTSFVWLKENKLDNETFTRDRVGEIWQNLMPRITRLERAYEKNLWPAKPSGLCPWCPLGRERCEFWKPKRG